MKSVLLIGLGNFGMEIARQVQRLGYEIMAVDKTEEKVTESLHYCTNAMIGDSTNKDFLASLGINNYDVCIETIGGDFQSSLETTSLLKELGGKLVVSRADSDVQEKFLLRNGADEVVNPKKFAAKWTAVVYTSEYIRDYVKLDEKYAIFDISLPKHWQGECIRNLKFKEKYGITILGIRENGEINLNVSQDDVFKENQTLVVMGEYKELRKCVHVFEKE